MQANNDTKLSVIDVSVFAQNISESRSRGKTASFSFRTSGLTYELTRAEHDDGSFENCLRITDEQVIEENFWSTYERSFRIEIGEIHLKNLIEFSLFNVLSQASDDISRQRLKRYLLDLLKRLEMAPAR